MTPEQYAARRRASHAVAWLLALVWLGIGAAVWRGAGWPYGALYALGSFLVLGITLAGYGLTDGGHRADLWQQITTPARPDDRK